MRFRPARTAVCTAADIECDLPAPRPPRNSQHHDRSGGGSCASRAAKTQSSAASSPSPRISSSASFGVISLMSWRNWCMRLTSLNKRSTIVVVLFHDFAFDVAIFLASYIIDERANFLGRQHTCLHPMEQFKCGSKHGHDELITGKIYSISARVPKRNVITDTPALSDGRQFQFVRKPLCAGDGKAAHLLQPGPVSKIDAVVLKIFALPYS